jgi:hypothetical protein
MKERKAVTKEVAQRYRKASKKQKGVILDEFTALTGYNRAYASYLLSNHGRTVKVGKETVIEADANKKIKRHRKKHYELIKKPLEKIWEVYGYPCGKRLKPILSEAIAKLKSFREINIESLAEEKLLKISASTIDRLLKEEKKKYELKSRFHTKPGTLLKSQIPIRTFSQWYEGGPGFLEIDLVGHEGGDPRGEFIQSLTGVDICTGWTEVDAIRNKAQRWVFEAIDNMKNRLPFELLGLDSDNGAEFINDHLYRYCLSNKITFTRTRKYRKNDNCYVEQKNYSAVRKYAGYFRYDTAEELQLLKELYRHLRLYLNFFQPVMKQVSKMRAGSKVMKRYDTAKTPYQRVLEASEVSDAIKERLKIQYKELNPAELHRQIVRLQNKLIEMAILKEEVRKSAKPICHRKGNPCYAYI